MSNTSSHAWCVGKMSKLIRFTGKLTSSSWSGNHNHWWGRHLGAFLQTIENGGQSSLWYYWRQPYHFLEKNAKLTQCHLEIIEILKLPSDCRKVLFQRIPYLPNNCTCLNKCTPWLFTLLGHISETTELITIKFSALITEIFMCSHH